MLLHNFLDRFEEERAKLRVRDYLEQDDDGADKAEFLGHYLNSVFQPILEITGTSLKTVGYESFVRCSRERAHFANAVFQRVGPRQQDLCGPADP